MDSALDIFVDATRRIRDLELPSRAQLEGMMKSAMALVARDLEANNIRGAIDTMEKTKAIEDYVKARVRHEKLDLVRGNVVVAGRLDILREIGWWLDENITRDVNKRYADYIDVIGDEKPKFFLDDIGVTPRQSYQWQEIASLPEEEYQEFRKPYLQDSAQDELYFYRLWKYMHPEYSDDPDEELGVELSKSGKKLYRQLKDVKRSVIDYFTSLGKEPVSIREIFFLIGTFEDIRKGLGGAEKKLKELTEVQRVDTPN